MRSRNDRSKETALTCSIRPTEVVHPVKRPGNCIATSQRDHVGAPIVFVQPPQFPTCLHAFYSLVGTLVDNWQSYERSILIANASQFAQSLAMD